MSARPEPTSNPVPPILPEPRGEESTPLPHARGELWARRIFLITLVCLCTVLGVILVILPWYPQWTENSLLTGYPRLQAFLANGFVRGVCSGLGLLDIWIAVSETLHYQE